MRQCKQLLWGSSKETMKSCFCVWKGIICSSFALEFYLSKGLLLSCKSVCALLYPHCAQVIAHKMHNWVANDIIEEISFLNTALNTVCFVYSSCAWLFVRICQLYLYCRSWCADLHQGRVNLGLMFLSPAVPHYCSPGPLGAWLGWQPHSIKREGDT